VLGLYYAKARMYDAENRRFVAVDQLKGFVENPMTMIQYVYVIDSPISFMDPTGNLPELTDITRTAAKLLFANPVSVHATQEGWFEDLFYAAGFIRDDDGIYHARQDALQQYGGYNDFYDNVFDYATSMESTKFEFNVAEQEYVFWGWKGDYLNLGAGAELGIYRKPAIDEISSFQSLVEGLPQSLRVAVNETMREHWVVDTSLALPMTLVLKDNDEKIVATYNPADPQWWITAFNPYRQGVKAENLTAMFTVDFSRSLENKEMFTALYKQWLILSNDLWVFNRCNYTAIASF
jgi:RHS repeat-associated protein